MSDKSFSNQSYSKLHLHTIIETVHSLGIYYTHHKKMDAPDNHIVTC
jgi:hypothetical protein